MKDELLFVTDENNQPLVLGVSRAEVHATLSHWHRCVSVTIINKNGEILCQQRSFEKDVSPGKWSTNFGGHIDHGEDVLKGAVREIAEEIGLNVRMEDLSQIYIRRNKHKKHFTYNYLLKYNEQMGVPEIVDGEVINLSWIPWKQLTDSEFTKNFVRSLPMKVVECIGTCNE